MWRKGLPIDAGRLPSVNGHGDPPAAQRQRCGDQMAAWMSQHKGTWNEARGWDNHMGEWRTRMMTR